MTAFDLIKLIAYDLIKSYLRRFVQCCKYMIEALTIITIKSNLQKSLKTCDCILTVPSGLYSFFFFLTIYVLIRTSSRLLLPYMDFTNDIGSSSREQICFEVSTIF